MERDRVTISLVFSFFNEEEVLPALVERVRAVFDGGDMPRVGGYEMIFVNDRSTDGSLAALIRLAGGRGDIRIITTSRKFGFAPCLMAGLEHATGDAVITLDADLQDPPELIPRMVGIWLGDGDRGGVDVVHTR